jgi:hypothetical protein
MGLVRLSTAKTESFGNLVVAFWGNRIEKDWLLFDYYAFAMRFGINFILYLNIVDIEVRNF